MERKYVVGQYLEEEMEAAMTLVSLSERVYLFDQPVDQVLPIDYSMPKCKKRRKKKNKGKNINFTENLPTVIIREEEEEIVIKEESESLLKSKPEFIIKEEPEFLLKEESEVMEDLFLEPDPEPDPEPEFEFEPQPELEFEPQLQLEFEPDPEPQDMEDLLPYIEIKNEPIEEEETETEYIELDIGWEETVVTTPEQDQLL